MHILARKRERGDDIPVALTLEDLSETNRSLGLHEEGVEQAKEALGIYERLGDATQRARCSNQLSWLLLANDQSESAVDAALHAIDLIPEKSNEYIVCGSHRILGNIYHSKRENEKAIHHLKAALELASRFDWEDELCWIHDALASLFLDQGDFNDAHAHVEQAKLHAAEIPYYLGRAMEAQARIFYREHRFEDTKSEALRALEVFEKLGAANDAGHCRDLLQRTEGAMESQSFQG
jgi:tetratricopeptide (TPR) repeat protein